MNVVVPGDVVNGRGVMHDELDYFDNPIANASPPIPPPLHEGQVTGLQGDWLAYQMATLNLGRGCTMSDKTRQDKGRKRSRTHLYVCFLGNAEACPLVKSKVRANAG